MDIEVKEKIIIDKPFRVRDLATCCRNDVEFLVLVLSAKYSKTYKGNSHSLTLVKNNVVYTWLNEVPEKTGNKSDIHERKEVMLDKFLHHMDEGLDSVLKAFPLPVFVIGPDRVAGHFKALTRHSRKIVEYIHNDAVECNEAEILNLLIPAISRWSAIKQQMLQKQIEMAADAGKLVYGIHAVRLAAKCQNSQLLIIEKDEQGDKTKKFYVEDGIDQVAEAVLANGGQIELVDSGFLEKYDHIVLIRYY